jgi:hypothetical protein
MIQRMISLPVSEIVVQAQINTLGGVIHILDAHIRLRDDVMPDPIGYAPFDSLLELDVNVVRCSSWNPSRYEARKVER